MTTGWIKLYKKFLSWEWYDDPITKSVFLDLLLSANFEDTQYHGTTVLRGQTVVGYPSMAKRLGISIQNARTSIKRLKSTNEITIKSTNRFSIITVTNYGKYQLGTLESNNQTNGQSNSHLTGNQQATNNTIRNKEYKEYKNIPPNPLKGNTDLLDEFNIFWPPYPNKANKQGAFKAFSRLSGIERKKAIAVLAAHCRSEQWQRDGGRFIPHAATWLNQKRFNDELSPVPQAPPPLPLTNAQEEFERKHPNFANQ